MKNQFKFNQPLTYSERERYAYLSGDVESADMFDKLIEQEDMESEIRDARASAYSAESAEEDAKTALSDIEKELSNLEDRCFDLEDELSKYKNITEELKEARSLTDVQDILDEFNGW